VGSVVSGWGHRGLAVAGRQLRSRPSDVGPADAAAATHDFPATGRIGPRRNAPPDAAPDEQDQAVILAPGEPVHRAEITVTGSGTPRLVRVGSSSVKGAPFGRVAKAMGASAHPLTPET
jgi:hypothetical protein